VAIGRYGRTISEEEAVLAANEAFYAAFEAKDMDAMSDLWEHTDRALCTHPGWGSLRGWGAIAASYFAIFQGPQPLQVILTREHAEVEGDVAWVTVDENLLGVEGGATIAALNLFVRHGGGWRLVAHTASQVLTRGDT
jgi:ketosteroid isomerase-like protein